MYCQSAYSLFSVIFPSHCSLYVMFDIEFRFTMTLGFILNISDYQRGKYVFIFTTNENTAGSWTHVVFRTHKEGNWRWLSIGHQYTDSIMLSPLVQSQQWKEEMCVLSRQRWTWLPPYLLNVIYLCNIPRIKIKNINQKRNVGIHVVAI